MNTWRLLPRIRILEIGTLLETENGRKKDVYLHSVEQHLVPLRADQLTDITKDDYICPHELMEFRCRTLTKSLAYMCRECYREIVEQATDPATIGFTNLSAKCLKQLLIRRL